MADRIFYPAVILLLAAVSVFADAYLQYLVNLALVYAVIACGLNLLLGYAGQFAFASAALMGIGAYATAIFMTRAGLPLWLVLPLSGLITAAIGSLAAIPAMRMKSVYLGLVTLAFAELVGWALLHGKVLTGGTDGLGVPRVTIPGLSLTRDQTIFVISFGVAIAMFGLARFLLASPLGRSFIAIRENEILARCNGIDVLATKIAAFAISSFFAGIGGALYALTIGFLQPESFGMAQLILHFTIVVIGGLGHLAGAILGAALLTALPEVLRDFQGLQEFVYGTLLVLVVVFMPDGLAGFLTDRRLLRREKLARGSTAHASRGQEGQP